MKHNIMRTDFRNFLTQRALQSFLHLLMECRDPHTVKWLEDFGGWKNLESFHGTGALNVTRFPSWSSVLMDVMQQPNDVVIVSAKRRGRGHGGWSKNNPYLEDRYVEFQIDIDPPSLATRILSVREQIADEWVTDLETLRVSNDMILESYNKKVKEAREAENCDDASYDNNECAVSAENRPRIFAFDRNAQYFLRNTMAVNDRASSMLRQGNFDLLALLATQESVHRVLRDYVDSGEEHSASFEWFRGFYVERVAKFFDGDKEHGSSDDFLEELLLAPPAVIAGENAKMGLVDPLRIAEDILTTRSNVAVEWKKIAIDTKDEHVTVRKELLEKQMAKWGQRPATKPVESKKTAEVAAAALNEQEIYGEFQ